VSAVQLARHAVAPQTYGLQAVVTGAGQLPAPSHEAAAVAVPLEHVAARQLVEPPGYAHAAVFVPSQVPPHTPVPLQAVRVPCGVPETATQVPTLPLTSQASHWLPQLVLQQTPSAQLLLEHSWSAPQVCATAFFGTHWFELSQ
jgi:hypothetical protein